MRQSIQALLIAATAAATPAVAAPRVNPDVQLQRLLAGRVPGKPVNCIRLSSMTSSQVIRGRAIVYRIGRRLYVNRPRSGASALTGDDVLATRTFGSQLCRNDSVRLVNRASGIPRNFVILGSFVPFTRVDRPR